MDSRSPPLKSIAEENRDNSDAAVQIIGKGYNLITKESASEDIFVYETRRSDFGIVVPSSAKSSKILHNSSSEYRAFKVGYFHDIVRSIVQRDHSTCSKPPKTSNQKFRFGLAWPGLARPKRNFCFEVNGRF